MAETDGSEREVAAAEAPAAAEAAVPRRRAARRLLRAEIYYGAALLAFAALTALAYFNAYFGWDLRVARALQTLPVPGFFEFMRLVSTVGDGWTPYALTAATVLLFFAVRRNSEAAGLLLSAAASGLIDRYLKLLIARPRPTADLVEVFRVRESYSFPSGHVTFYVCYFGFLFFVAYAILPRGSTARRLALAAAALPVLLVGPSRVTLGEHWPSDTLGAYLLGGLWLGFSLHIYRRWKERATFHGGPGDDGGGAEALNR